MNKKELFISLTDACNLSCVYCNRNTGNAFIKLDVFSYIISQVISLKGKIDYINIWGGEPFIHPSFDLIVDILIEKFSSYNNEIIIAINTNGILLSHKIDILTKLFNGLSNIKFKLYVSIDGLGKKGNMLRGISENKFLKILDSILFLKNFSKTISNLEISISSVIALDIVNMVDFKKFIDFFMVKNIKMGFCLQSHGGKKVCINNEVKKSILERCIFLKSKGITYTIESINDLNKNLKCDTGGIIYNFIDKYFCDTDKYIVSKNGNLDFLYHDNWYMHLDNNEIFSILYRNPEYIKIIKYLYKYG